MAIPLPADGKGATLTFPGLVANLISIEGPVMSRAKIDATHMGTAAVKNYIPEKLWEAGEVTCVIEFDPSYVPPINGASGSLAILWGSTTPNTWTWPSTFCTSFKTGAKIGARMEATVQFKLTQPFAIT